MTRTAFVALALLLASGAQAQEVRYDIAFPNAAHREAEITVTWTGLPAGPLAVRMSRSSPGRYALHEFAKNVYSVRAEDGSGNPLPVSQRDPYGWDVSGHTGSVRFSYTLYGDRADGTYTGIDATHAHLNMPATFAWARGTERQPIRIAFHVPEGSGWNVATQLQPTDDAYVFRAPHLQYFLDSPTELSDFTLRNWPVTHAGRSYTIRLALHHTGSAADADAYAEMARQVVAEQIAMWGEPPEFDFGTYTFIACYLPWAAGDGMEHRNSTILTSTASLEQNARPLLGTLSHEFFHAWNVERLRPADLEPFDFERANMSGALWFAEGFTSYYDDLFIRRAGLSDDRQYFEGLAGGLNAVILGRGRRYFSPVEMSMQAPFVDAAVSIDPNNRANTFISYYTWGAMLGVGLDLSLRTRFPGKSLDDVMRSLWASHGRAQQDYAPTRPYSLGDLRAAVASVSGDADFANDFFERFVHGREVPDYEALLARMGLLLRKAAPGVASLGFVPWQARDGRVIVAGSTPWGTPAYEAGLDRGDVLLSLEGAPIRSTADLQQLLAARGPGDEVTLEFEHRGRRRNARVPLMEEPRLEIVPFEQDGRSVTDEMLRLRSDWLGRKARS